eukprot:2183327-Rhodomonas_salina.6
MSGTDIAYRTTRAAVDSRYVALGHHGAAERLVGVKSAGEQEAWLLRGTDICDAQYRGSACHAMLGTDIAYASRCP